jgi:hypothetical protein
VRASRNIELARIGLVRSVDCEHESEMALFASATTTHPINQVDYKVILAMYRRMIGTSSLMYEQITMQGKLTLFFPLQFRKKPHDDEQFVHLFLIWVWLQTTSILQLSQINYSTESHPTTIPQPGHIN